MPSPEAMHQSKMKSVRWEILRTLSVAGYMGTTEGVILTTLRATWLDLSRDYIRNQLDYLEKRKLIKLEREEIMPWQATLTRHGDDLVNYIVDCEPGIARPKKYWRPDDEQVPN